MEKTKSRPLLKKKSIWHKWYDWLISHTPNPAKKFVKDVKKKLWVMFPRTVNHKKIQAPSIISISNTKVKVMSNYQSRNIFKTLDHIHVVWYTVLEYLGKRKFIWQCKWISYQQKIAMRNVWCILRVITKKS